MAIWWWRGSRATEINGEKHWVKLSGMVRPNDVDNTNSVLSYRVANAEISYQKEESLRQAWRRPGKLRRSVMYGIGATPGGSNFGTGIAVISATVQSVVLHYEISV